MSFRTEKKYRLSHFDLLLLKQKLIKKGLKILYPPRIIFSKYLDTNNLQMFSDSEEGVLPRKKIRIRWYDKTNEKNLETKISSIEGRFKLSKKYIDVHNNNSKLIVDSVYGKIYPSALIKYSREYYYFKQLRITIDTKIHYTDVRHNLMMGAYDNDDVLEVKTDHKTSNDYIEKIIPYPTSRFSKYCRGISFLSGMI